MLCILICSAGAVVPHMQAPTFCANLSEVVAMKLTDFILIDTALDMQPIQILAHDELQFVLLHQLD